LPPKAGPKPQPVAANLIGSLVDLKTSVNALQFSPDSRRLLTAGSPGIVQIWDLASRKEVRRIDTGTDYLGSSDGAQLTPDWKTLYILVQKRSVKEFERDGKRHYRIDYAGRICVWDVDSWQEKEPLLPAPGSAPQTGQLDPSGRYLVGIERKGYDSSDPRVTDVTVVWDLAAGKKWKLCDGAGYPAFCADAKTVLVSLFDKETRASTLKVLDLADGREPAQVTCRAKGRYFNLGPVAPDGEVVAVYLGGKKEDPLEVRFLDARTLEDRGKLITKGHPDWYGWGSGRFTPDGKRFVALDGLGSLLIWDLAGRKVEHTLAFGGEQFRAELAVSPEGKTVAVAWAPRADKEFEDAFRVDPLDLPQPRVSLLDLAGDRPPRVLVAPHGFVGRLAFSPDGKMIAFTSGGAVHLFDLTK
jgi:WD40 repeat protein